MFHRPSLLFTGIVLMMGLAWFALENFGSEGRVASAETVRADEGVAGRD